MKANIKKVFLGGLAGGVVIFFLGWLIHGVLLANFEATNSSTVGTSKVPPDFGPLIGGHIVWGFLLAVILLWANTKSVLEGFQNGAIVGLLYSLSSGLSSFGVSKLTTLDGLLVGIVVAAASNAITGAVIGFILRRMHNHDKRQAFSAL